LILHLSAAGMLLKIRSVVMQKQITPRMLPCSNPILLFILSKDLRTACQKAW
jgi:hypothetical protein